MSSSLLTEPPLNPTHEPFHVDRVLKPAVPQPEVIAVLPAYNAEKTLAATIADFRPAAWTKSCSWTTAARTAPSRSARDMGLTIIVHEKNTGYGGNQKTCYKYCLDHARTSW